jgi:hypothetical protein
MPTETDISGIYIEITTLDVSGSVPQDVSGSQQEETDTQEEEEAQETKDPDPLVAQSFKFNEIRTQFEDTYNAESETFSGILDLIAVYLKGQKILYTEAKTLCELRLNYLMLPAILITALCSILSLVLKDYGFGAIIVSCLNGGNAFILALVSYLKLDARSESHRSSAYKFDKIQSSIVFSSGRALFGTLKKKEIIALIEKVEKDVTEIKESNQFVLPELIRISFPHVYGTNVFAEAKTIMNDATVNIERLRNIANDRELARVAFLTATPEKPEQKEAAKLTFDTVTDEYRRQVRICIQQREKYKNLDTELEKELRERVQAQRRWSFNVCGCLKN